ncbi:MAG TPA: hypothetical protein VK576_02135 [Thermoleophilia bacterium]|nr:hypothetical protein [Thermoleophilia bacterium]
MATLHGTIDADVPIAFADREWREFIGRSVYRRFPRGYDDVASAISEIDADDGTVTFTAEPSGGTRVSVDLVYSPGGERVEAERAQRRLDHELLKYREFVLRRCDEVSCRTAA